MKIGNENFLGERELNPADMPSYLWLPNPLYHLHLFEILQYKIKTGSPETFLDFSASEFSKSTMNTTIWSYHNCLIIMKNHHLFGQSKAWMEQLQSTKASTVGGKRIWLIVEILHSLLIMVITLNFIDLYWSFNSKVILRYIEVYIGFKLKSYRSLNIYYKN